MFTDYTYKISSRAKRLRITIKPTQEVIITIPKRMSRFMAERFVRSKERWIAQQLAKVVQLPSKHSFAHLTVDDYQKHKETARKCITERVEFFNAELQYPYKKIAIRNQTTRWGSCSSKQNLNFNYKLLFLPDDLRDYVVVHELCHLEQMNHSKDFWKLVENVLPNYRSLRKELRTEYRL